MTTMLHFDCDYLEGAHPLVLQRIAETNLEQTTGYGFDHYCDQAKSKIRQACNKPDADVFFFVGGTQTNATVIDAYLKPWQGVVSTETGHVATHEAGAIESSGHKVIELSQLQGRLEAKTLHSYLERFLADPSHSHMVQPGLIYISHPTEYGSLYSKSQLQALREVCNDYDLPLFLDGARLGYALAAPDNTVSLEDLANYCDAFYIGGTKVGALFGEALVFPKGSPSKHFFTLMKRHGTVLAKGRLLGLQFDALFSNKLYFSIARHAIDQAMRIKEAFMEKGYRLHLDSPTNQQFVVLENSKMEELKKQVSFDFWESLDENHSVVRFATSWATRPEDVDALIDLL